MKSTRIIHILFCLVSVYSFANTLANVTLVFFTEKNEIDSLYYLQTQTNLKTNDAKSVVIAYDKAIAKGLVLTVEDLKRLAISYALLSEAKKSSQFLDRYIKKAHQIDILNRDAFTNIRDSEEFISVVKKYKPELSGWIIFLFSAGLIGVFIAVVLNLRKKCDRIANLLISSFVLIHSLFIIHLGLFLSNYSFNFPHSLYITTSFSFLYGPLLYFYFKRITSRYQFRMVDILHVIPSVALFLFFLPIYFLSQDEKLHILYNRYQTTYNLLIVIVVLKTISLFVYGYFVYKIYRKALVNNPKRNEEILSWQKNIMILNTIYVISYIIYGVTIIAFVESTYLIYPQVFIMSIIVLYVGYIAYVQPKVFSEKYLFQGLSLFKYKKSGLTESYSLELKEQLLIMLNKDKIYKSNDLNLDVLSERLGTTRHSVSQVINEHFSMNFFNLINKYRIQEAKDIFKNDAYKQMKIIDVAYDVGFNNKVTFNKAFKEETKLTPSQYLHKLRKTNIATPA